MYDSLPPSVCSRAESQLSLLFEGFFPKRGGVASHRNRGQWKVSPLEKRTATPTSDRQQAIRLN
jgi:hypothetical protein